VGLILGRSRDILVHGEVGQKCRNLLLAHIAGMALVMEQDEPLYPLKIGSLGTQAVVPDEGKRGLKRGQIYLHMQATKGL
jgi:hypothetical protein